MQYIKVNICVYIYILKMKSKRFWTFWLKNINTYVHIISFKLHNTPAKRSIKFPIVQINTLNIYEGRKQPENDTVVNGKRDFESLPKAAVDRPPSRWRSLPNCKYMDKAWSSTKKKTTTTHRILLTLFICIATSMYVHTYNIMNIYFFYPALWDNIVG